MVDLTSTWRFLVYLSVVNLAVARGKIIDIFNGGKGDILQLQREPKTHSDGKFQNAIFSNSERKWNVKDSNGNIVIPYIITGKYDSIELSTIKEAMKRIERNTCIRFRWRRSEADYVDIQNEKDEGCYTSVGRLKGKSVLMLEAGDDSTCVVTQIVQHELLHVVGLWHEHMRYDRDKYVRVHYKNILPGDKAQFDIISSKESTVYNIPYDYRSVMHYGKTAFAQPGKITMETRDPKYTDIIGTQSDASTRDYQKVCKVYNCRVCNNGVIDSRRDDENTNPWKPQPKPEPLSEDCSDKLSSFCGILKKIRLLDCSYDAVKKFCCDTCNGASL